MKTNTAAKLRTMTNENAPGMTEEEKDFARTFVRMAAERGYSTEQLLVGVRVAVLRFRDEKAAGMIP